MSEALASGRGSRYPLQMQHPHFKPAIRGDFSTEIKNGVPVQVGHQGHAAIFPPVVVGNPSEEEFMASRGYRADMKGTPRAMMVDFEPPKPTDYVAPEYPRYVGTILCKTPEEADAARATIAEEEARKKAEAEAPAAALPTGPLDQAELGAERVSALEKQVLALVASQTKIIEALDRLVAPAVSHPAPPQPAAAPAAPLAKKAAAAPGEKAALIARLKELGVVSRGNWGLPRLRWEIESAKRKAKE